MYRSKVQLVFASVALIATAFLAHFLAPHELLAKRSANLNLEAIVPKEFGIWTPAPGVSPITPPEPDGYVEPDEYSTRIYSQEVGRAYTDGRGDIVMLVIAYGPVQNYRLKAHRPEICYTASGFRVSPKSSAEVNYDGNDRPIKVARLVAQRENRYEPITYWIRVGNDVTTGIVDYQLVRLKYGLRGMIPDGALIRVSTLGLAKDQSYKVQDQFIRDFLAAISPQDRKFFTGDS